GLLEPLARHLCYRHLCNPDIYEANTFRRILSLHPEWKQQFRKWTSGGLAHSHTANLERTIPKRDKRLRVRYTIPYVDGTF
ncbi:hypothetical protein PENTCL1PPCAC_1950, partial [Pristionchus entomophagus]